MREIRTPTGRESSVKAHVDAVQIHFPAIGSQKGVEQFAGTEGVRIMSMVKSTIEDNTYDGIEEARR